MEKDTKVNILYLPFNTNLKLQISTLLKERENSRVEAVRRAENTRNLRNIIRYELA